MQTLSTAPRAPIGWRPVGVWQWLLSAIAAVLLVVTLMVGYYVVNPGAFGALASMVAYAAMIFPLLFLIWIAGSVLLAIIAYWSRARLAGAASVLAAVLALLMVAWQTLGMWLMARRENIAVSAISHFAFDEHMKDLPSRVSRNVVYGKAADGTELVLDFWPATGPAQRALRPAFVRVHGGAWIHGAKSELPNWDEWLNELGYAVFDVEHRMPPPEAGRTKSAT
jgi:hypothetical protein